MWWLKRFAMLAAIASLLVGIVWALLPQPIEVETAVVSRGPFEETILEDGKTRVRERYVVAAPLAGTLLRVGLKPGDAVAAGATVAEILPNRAPLLDARARQEAEQRLGAAEATEARAVAALAGATAARAQALNDAVRTRALAARDVVARSRLEHDELALTTAERELEAATAARHAAAHEVAAARAVLFMDTPAVGTAPAWPVQTPVASRVLRVMQESETPVANGTPLVEIGDPADLEVVADLLTVDAVRVHAGDPVRIENWGGPTPLEGTVRRVEPGGFTKVSALGVDEQRTNVVIDLVSPVSARPTLGDAFRVEARIVVATLADALRVPSAALFRDQAGWAVFAVQRGRAVRRSVTLAGRGDVTAAVGSGLTAGDTVILFPADTLADGARVRPRPIR